MKRSDLGFLLVLAAAAIAVPRLPAQPPAAQPASAPAGEAALANAIVVEEHEHDLKAAERLYTAVTDDGACAELVRQRAWLRLGQLYRKLGQQDDATAALQRAAKGPGEVGDEARRLLQEPSQDKERLAKLTETARQLIAELKVRGGSADDLVRDLFWCGDPAVPEIIRALEVASRERTSNNFYAGKLVVALWKIGGEQARRFVTAAAGNPDISYRRLIAGGMPNDLGPGMVEKAALFLADPDESGEIPLVVLRLATMFPAIRTVELVGHHLPNVKVRALDTLRGNWQRMQHDPDPEATMHALAPLLQKALDDVDPQVSQAATRFLSCEGIMASREGRSILLARLPELPSTFSVNIPNLWPKNLRSETEQLDEVLKAARELGVRASLPYPKANTCDQVVSFYTSQWGRPAFDGILELVGLGYGVDRLAELATPDDQAKIIRALADRDTPFWILHQFRDHDLPADLWPVLRRKAEQSDLSNQPRGWVPNLFLAMARTGATDAGPYLLEWIEKDPALRDPASDALMRLSDRNRSDVVIECLRRAMVTEGDSTDTRNELFARLAQLGDVGSIPLYAKAEALGVKRCSSYPLPSAPIAMVARGFEWLGAISPTGAAPVVWQGYEPAELARCWDTLLSADDADAWAASWVALNADYRSHSPLSSPILDRNNLVTVPTGFVDPAPEVIEVLSRRWAERVTAPDFQPDPSKCLALLLWIPHVKATADRKALQAIEQLHLACFKSRSTAVKLLALEMAKPPMSAELAAAVLASLFDDSEQVAHQAIDRFAWAKEPVPKEALAKVLAHPSGAIRADAVDSLATAAGPNAYDMVAPLLKDPDGSVRIAACRYLGKMARADAVPALLDTLRDPETGVHDAAEWALSAIRFYYDEKAHWDRVFAGTALSANSAAEALVAEARADGNDKKVRLLAIESLGHLGVLEALPILIGFTQESDADIAAAAQRAIERIHEKAARRGADAAGAAGEKK